MKKLISISFVFVAIILNSCTNGQNKSGKTNLSATQFSAKIKEIPTAPLVDVRSAEEYSSGHIQGSKNINWNGDNFESEIVKLDKTKPVFVYCQSGRRSASAADRMRSLGFKEVYELDGGISEWMQADLPVSTN
ncbi:MAG: rhodanese-like domain-containing protein [Bacteroidia bacterium]